MVVFSFQTAECKLLIFSSVIYLGPLRELFLHVCMESSDKQLVMQVQQLKLLVFNTLSVSPVFGEI